MADRDILILEDEALIAMDIELALLDHGYTDIHVCSSVRAALERIELSPPRLSLLDFNLGRGETSIPVARALLAIERPFAFLTGYTGSTLAITADLRDIELLSKPFRTQDIVDFMDRNLGV